MFQSSVWVCRLSADGVIAEVNATMAQGLGQTPEALSGEAFVDRAVAAVRADLDGRLGTLREGLRPASLTAQMGDENGAWIAWEATPSEGGSLWIGHDVSTLSEDLAALRANELRLRGFVEHSPDTYLVHDMDGRLVDVNLAACENLGYTREELLQAHIPEIELSIKPGSQRGIWNRMTPGNAVVVEGRHRRKDGSTFPVEARLGVFGPPDGLLLFALCHDISVRKRSERNLELRNAELREARDQALAANNAKSAFLASMSHELRTPLNAITGYAELIEEELEDAGFSALGPDTQRIQQASAHLLHLINEILDLSKIEAGRIVLRWRTFAVNEVIESVLQVVRPLYDRAGNQLVCEVGPEVNKITSDASRLQQVLMNLLSNANKFTHKGTVTLEVSGFVPPGESGDWVRFAVKDTGIGIDADALTRIFEPFVQADATTTKRYDGTGLGLTISRRLCRLLGGELQAQSELGEGSTFTISLPRRPLARDESPLPPLAASRPLQQDIEVLLLAENEALHEQFAHALLCEGVKMRSAMSGAKGLADVRAYQPQCVLLHMPSSDEAHKFDAWAWLDQSRNDPAVARIPIVLLTSEMLTEEERILLGNRVRWIFESPEERAEEIAGVLVQRL